MWSSWCGDCGQGDRTFSRGLLWGLHETASPTDVHEYGRLDVAIAGKERAPSADKNCGVYAEQHAQQPHDSPFESLDKTSRSRSGNDSEHGRLDVATAGKGRTSSVHKGQRSGKRRPSSEDRYYLVSMAGEVKDPTQGVNV